MAAPDPYVTLGIARTATDAEVRSAYRRLVQLHHPDHNGGSPESERRFEEVQEAYAEVRRRGATGTPSGASASPPRSASADPDISARLAAMEQELRAARDEAARRAREAAVNARRAAEARIRERSAGAPGRASDEELGYFSTQDSFSKILSDAAADWGERLDHVADEAHDAPVTQKFADLIDELGSKLTGESRGCKRD